MKTISIDFEVGVDFNFWALFPAINLNFTHGFTFEIEFLCFSLYADFEREEDVMKKYK